MNAGDYMQFAYRLQREHFLLDITASVPPRGISGLFGKSGAGKTTLLRCVAGLEAAPGSKLTVAGEVWQDAKFSRAPHERNIGYVFQEPRLFRNLDVRGNIEYGMRRSGTGGASIDAMVELLGLQDLLRRRPAELSGGEAQRVAIARALMRAPRFVLMDEPLAALDVQRRHEILPFLERLHAECSVPILYVSHSLDEICRLCDYLLVMEQGRLLASGELQNVLVQTPLAELAGDEAGSVINGEIEGFDKHYGLSRMIFSGGIIWLPGRPVAIGSKLRLRIRANDVSLCRERVAASTVLNQLDAVIDDMQNSVAPTQLVRLRVGRERLIARITRRSREELNLRSGDQVIAQVKAVAVRGPEIGVQEDE